MNLLVEPRKFLILVAVVVTGLNAASMALRLVGLQWGISTDDPSSADRDPFAGFSFLLWQLSVEADGNIPTWINGALLVMASLLAWGVAVTARRENEPRHRYWTALTIVLAYLSLDELTALHERASAVMARLVEPTGVFSFGWVLVALPLATGLALLFVPFLRSLPSRTRALMVTAGALYVSGAAGMEMLSAYFFSIEGGTMQSVHYVIASNVEELLEMIGVTILVYAVADHSRRRPPGAQLLPPPGVPRPVAPHPRDATERVGRPG